MPLDEHIPAGLEPYFKLNRDGSFSIIDMVTKKAAIAGEIPGFITASTYYSDGIKNLKKYAKELDLDIWFGRHRKSIDLGDSKQLPKALKEADVYIPEGVYWDQQDIDLWDEITDSPKPRSEKVITKMLVDLGLSPDSSFDRARLLAVAGSGVTVRYIDYTNYDFKDTPGLETFNKAFRAYEKDHGRSGRDYCYWWATYNYYREWIMVANLGAMIGKTKSSSGKPLRVVMTLGAHHQDLIAKLQKFDVNPTITWPRPIEEQKRVLQQEATILAKYRYTPADLSHYRGLSEITWH